MKKSLFLLFALCTSIATPSFAMPILSLDRVSPSVPVINGGDTATFELSISGLTSLLGAFSADISFDPGVLNFLPAATLAEQFGTRLGIPPTQAVGFADVTAPGVLHVDEVSLLSTAELDGLQRDGSGNLLPSFVLADISFQGVSGGVSVLDFVPGSVVLSDDAGTALPTPALGPSVIRVIPEPGASWLFVIGFAALIAINREKAGQQTKARPSLA